MRNSDKQGDTEANVFCNKWLYTGLTVAALTSGVAFGEQVARAATTPTTQMSETDSTDKQKQSTETAAKLNDSDNDSGDEAAGTDSETADQQKPGGQEESVSGATPGDTDDDQLDKLPEQPADNQEPNQDGNNHEIPDSVDVSDGGDDTLDDDAEEPDDTTGQTQNLKKTRSLLKVTDSTSVSDFSFEELADGNVAVTGYTGDAQRQADGTAPVGGFSTAITIPDMYEGKYVTEIAANAFNATLGTAITKLTQVTIGQNIHAIKENAFAGNQLTSLTLPGTWIYIYSGAFADNELKAVDLNGAVAIWDNAFKNNQLTTVTIPDAVTRIGDYAFQNNRLTDVKLSQNLTQIGTSAFQNNTLTGTVTIPDTVTDLGDFAFADNSELQGVALSQNLTRIGTGAFQNDGLTGTVTIPDTVTDLGDFAFANNKGLQGVVLGQNLKRIGTSAFQGDALTGTLTIPDSVTDLGAASFASNQLTGVHLSSQLTKLNNDIFKDNLLTGTLVIPDGITSIGQAAFANNQLTGLTFGSQVQTIAERAFADNMLAGGLVFPDSILNIGTSAFQNNKLAAVQFGNQVVTLDEWSFANNSLQDINATGTVGSIGDNAFADQSALVLDGVGTTVTSALGVKQLLRDAIGLANFDLANLTFSIGETPEDYRQLAYNEYTDTLMLPAGLSATLSDDNSVPTSFLVHFASGGTDTGRLGVHTLELKLYKLMESAQVNIPSNLGTLTTEDYYEGQVGSTLKVPAPVIAGYEMDPMAVTATVNLASVTTPDYVLYVKSGSQRPDIDSEVDPIDPVTPVTPTSPSKPGSTSEITTPSVTAETKRHTTDVPVQTYLDTPRPIDSDTISVHNNQWTYTPRQAAQIVVTGEGVPSVGASTVMKKNTAQPQVRTQKSVTDKGAQSTVATKATTLPQTNEQNSQWRWLGAIGLLAASWLGVMKKKQDD